MRTISVSELKSEYARRSPKGHFFDRATMRFFRSRIAQTAYVAGDGSVFFVTSEQFTASAPRRYTARILTPVGGVYSIGEFRAFADLRTAHGAARAACEAREVAGSR